MAALDGEWRESQTKLVELPKDDVNAFRLYLNWIYKRKLPCAGDVTVRSYPLSETQIS